MDSYDAINQIQSEAGSSYNGMTVTVNRQFTQDLELMAGYTSSKTIGNSPYDAEQPQNLMRPATSAAFRSMIRVRVLR